MLNNKKEVSFKYGEHQVTIETGRMAKQADASVLVSAGGTQVLVSVCSATTLSPSMDFFPLLIDYKEKFYAAGKFLGGFFKREGRPSNSEILLMRMIDRPLRPMFPEGYLYETVITAQVLSYDPAVDPQILAGLGATASLLLSDIPFSVPVGFARIGKIKNQLVLNPTDFTDASLDMIVAGTADAILMVEGEANEASEAEMLEAITFAHNQIKQFSKVMLDFQKQAGKEKRKFTPAVINKDMVGKVKSKFNDKVIAAIGINDKLERGKAISAIKTAVAEEMKLNPASFSLTEDANFSTESNKAVEEVLYTTMRSEILDKGKRINGRGIKEIRPIEIEVDILKNVHGSSLFTRGETQVLAAVTLGGKEGDQLNDTIRGLYYDKFYLHYSFMPFSVGEARGYRGVGRREVGHGNLAERALKVMLPKENPYTIRVACEVLESNGSSSMASVCSGSLALMDAGVPLGAPVAGIAMGLIKEGEKYQILSDILGDEDHLGDMDFKVAGTNKGITAIQMDIKITGITTEIMSKALDQAREGRIHILGKMAQVLSAGKSSYKTGVPLIQMTKIAPDQIGALIGPGGKNIKAIQEEYKVTIEVAEDGTVKVLGLDAQKLSAVANLISLQLNGPAIGAVYDAVVVTLKEYGAFVDIAQGVSGLVHVSEISNDRVQDVGEYLSEGDSVKVKVMEVDRFGKVRLSIKAVAPIEKKKK
jgi:polyribonucleotide nucleotidyltransferase